MNMYAERAEKTLPEKNNTNIPRKMKTKFEHSSGFSFDDVRVHYNSEKPAQLHAHAYTQGNNVYVAPGQEKHLPHELGHVVQQKSGTVEPNGEIGGLPLNDDQAMESGADKIAEEAENVSGFENLPVQAKFKDDVVVQRYGTGQPRRNYNVQQAGGNISQIFNLQQSEESSTQDSYNMWAGMGATIIGALGLAGGIAGFLYQKHTDRKHRYIEEIEKYADAACDALEEQIAAASLYNSIRNGNEALETAQAEAEIKKQKLKVKRNYMAAVRKAGAKKEGVFFRSDTMGKSNSNDILRADGLTDYINEHDNNPANQGQGGANRDTVKENITQIEDENVRNAIVRAREAYKLSIKAENNPHAGNARPAANNAIQENRRINNPDIQDGGINNDHMPNANAVNENQHELQPVGQDGEIEAVGRLEGVNDEVVVEHDGGQPVNRDEQGVPEDNVDVPNANAENEEDQPELQPVGQGGEIEAVERLAGVNDGVVVEQHDGLLPVNQGEQEDP